MSQTTRPAGRGGDDRRPPVEFDRIPECLRAPAQWVLWRYVARGGKRTKVPFRADGTPADATDPATWTTFGAARAAYEADGSFDGVGYVLAADDPYCVLDLT